MSLILKNNMIGIFVFRVVYEVRVIKTDRKNGRKGTDVLIMFFYIEVTTKWARMKKVGKGPHLFRE